MRWRDAALQVRVGLFTLLLLGLGAGLILVSGGKTRLLGDTYPLRASFAGVDGLVVGSPVRLAGLTVGRVTGFDLDAAGGQQVTVEMAVSRRFQERIRADSVASLGTAGVVGDRFVQITLGSPTARVLPPGAAIPSRDTADLSRLLAQGNQLLGHLNQVALSMQTMLGTLNQEGVASDVAATLRSLRNVSRELEEGHGLGHELIYDRDVPKRLDAAAAHLEAILREVHEGDGTLHALIYGNPDESLGRLGRALASLERTARQLEDAAGQLREGDGLLHSLLYDPEGKQIVADLREASRYLNALLRETREGDGLLRALLTEPGGRAFVQDLQRTSRSLAALAEKAEKGGGPEMIENLRQVSENLKTITGKIARGEGTIGALIDDPTVYEDLSSLLRGANRSWLLRALIRSNVARGRDQGEANGTEKP